MDIRPGRDSPLARHANKNRRRESRLCPREANELLVLIFACSWPTCTTTMTTVVTITVAVTMNARVGDIFRVLRMTVMTIRSRGRPWNICRLKTPLKPVSKHRRCKRVGFYLNSQVLALSECALGVPSGLRMSFWERNFLRLRSEVSLSRLPLAVIFLARKLFSNSS